MDARRLRQLDQAELSAYLWRRLRLEESDPPVAARFGAEPPEQFVYEAVCETEGAGLRRRVLEAIRESLARLAHMETERGQVVWTDPVSDQQLGSLAFLASWLNAPQLLPALETFCYPWLARWRTAGGAYSEGQFHFLRAMARMDESPALAGLWRDLWKNAPRDLRGLIGTWENVQRAVREDPAPCCVYQEPGLVERVVRDWLTEDVDKIVVDSREEYDRVREIAKRVANRGRSSIQLYDGPLPVFEHHDVERQIEETYRRQVSLKSGGYIVFDETEALIAVDVNTGRHKGRGGSQEQAILEVNTEAVEEVSRQLRLRNVGGIVVVDLIDMKSKKHQGAVYRTMKAALKRDRARTNVLPISELGLLEMTRQRAEESLRSSLYVDCPYCHGHGSVKSPLAMSVDIQRQIAAVMRRWGKGERHPELQIVVHPTVLDRLRREDEEFLVDLERKHDGRLSFKSDSSKHMEFFAIVDTAANDVLYSSRER